MYKNLKYLIGILLFILFLFTISSSVYATDTFSTDDGITVTKKTIGNDGTLEFNISNASFDESLEYKWGIAKSKSYESVEDWFALSIGSTARTANFNLTYNSSSSVKQILYSTDIAYLYVKENTNDTLLIDGLKLALTLDPEELVKVSDEFSTFYKIFEIYNISPNSYQFIKTENGTNIPDSGWKSFDNIMSYSGYSIINDENWVTENGTYYLWVKYLESGSKAVYGYTTITIDDSSPTVSSIKIVSPSSGTYKTPQTVKITVYFSEKITGTTVPTLKIKFGDSPERSLTNGTIKNTGYSTPCIEYSYNIQDTDKGQLQTVSLSGGNITDENGNVAKLSCPLLSGSITIKANMEGSTTNNTDNQDTTNNDNKTDNSDTDSSNKDNSNNSNINNSDTSNNNKNENTNKENNNTLSKDDNTTASGTIPQTGIKITLVLIIILLFICCLVTYFKCSKFKDI